MARVSVLFSEPKIPQFRIAQSRCEERHRFQCSSASRKFLNRGRCASSRGSIYVSVLFSEPKIPQCKDHGVVYSVYRSFSALQRAENSSIQTRASTSNTSRTFQCSSASRKFLNRARHRHRSGDDPGFSALQRAENSSIAAAQTGETADVRVSVLFSEPKIPQFARLRLYNKSAESFQCSSASRKFLNMNGPECGSHHTAFQCSSASRKFLNHQWRTVHRARVQFQCSSASRKFLN